MLRRQKHALSQTTSTMVLATHWEVPSVVGSKRVRGSHPISLLMFPHFFIPSVFPRTKTNK